jgi:hypothetical protein
MGTAGFYFVFYCFHLNSEKLGSANKINVMEMYWVHRSNTPRNVYLRATQRSIINVTLGLFIPRKSSRYPSVVSLYSLHSWADCGAGEEKNTGS